MKNLKVYLVFALLTIMLLIQSFSFAQNDCPFSEWYPNFSAPSGFTGGLYKPQRTDSAEGQELPPEAAFRIVIVFVQFPDEDATTNNSEWPIGQPPIYMDSLLATVRKNSGSFWDRYNPTKERLSDYYQEVSRGQFHMIGITRHYIFDHNRAWYNGNTTTMNNEVYYKLQDDDNINWPDFDKWQRLTEGNYRYIGEGKLDFLTMVRRTYSGDAGFVPLDGSEFEIDPVNHIFISTSYDQYGSGSIIQGNMGFPHSFNKFFGIFIHEFGHYIWGDHSGLGIMTSRGGNSINDLFSSPFEKIKLGYINPKVINYSQTSTYSIGDISSRSTNNEILKVPISSNEYFLIENRRKISKYDVKMLGDTTRLNMLTDSNSYGKGVYIYHHLSNDLSYPGGQDEECADGLYNWQIYGKVIPDWSTSDSVVNYRKISIPNPILNDPGTWGSLSNRDGESMAYWLNGGHHPVLFSLGKKHLSVGLSGTDKIFTNYPEYWTSRDAWGDRFDAWNIGYNEIFSPYSNPNTKNWNDSSTGIFIYYNTLSSGNANFKIYKTGQGFTEAEILAVTPPSKPMGIVVDYYFESENYMRPRITWNHNMEPDMMRISDSTKKYKIWRATQTSMYYVPINYTLLETKDIYYQTSPSFIDTSIIGYGSGWPGMGEQIQYPVRYKVQAIDKYADSSVRSDFGSVIGLRNCGAACASTEDNILSNKQLPNEYSINQNYPNPFNPSTNIKYEIPQDNFVSIKIYNLLGKEVMNLINDFKKAGSYNISFDGSNLPSGVYYYKIKAGEFVQIRKMVLIK